jgi:hypothetical protein
MNCTNFPIYQSLPLWGLLNEQKNTIPPQNSPIYFRNFTIKGENILFKYGSFSAIPSSIYTDHPINKRIWNLNISFLASPNNSNIYNILINGKYINPKIDTISFEDPLSGTINIGLNSYNANAYITYDWNKKNLYQILLIFTSPIIITENTFVNFNININDNSCESNNSPNCCSQQCNGSCTCSNCSGCGANCTGCSR